MKTERVSWERENRPKGLSVMLECRVCSKLSDLPSFLATRTGLPVPFFVKFMVSFFRVPLGAPIVPPAA